ncbi:MAG: cupin domain-containing protein [Deltaproteobacteria bacterium]|nr:cupin domain-containing protein [Deltaproteobacteria bacterium]
MEIYYDMNDLPWENHPTVPNVSIQKMITRAQFGPESPSILTVRIPAGVEVPEHVHENSEDILCILSGKATMWVDGTGKIALYRGVVVRVPRNTRHRIYDVTETLLIYDVFSPGTL